MSGIATAVIGGSVIGGAVSLAGANKQAKAISETNAQNAKNVADTNALNYQIWRESRGMDSNGNAINTRLPLWMEATLGTDGRLVKTLPAAGTTQAQLSSNGRRLVKRGAVAPAATPVTPSVPGNNVGPGQGAPAANPYYTREIT